MKGVVYHTDKEWFDYLINNNLLNDVNFWTRRKTNLNIQEGDVFFFKVTELGIVGAADFKSYERNMTVKDAWLRFGPKNGVNSLEELKRSLRNTLKISGNDNDTVSAIILDNLVKFKKPVKLDDVDLDKHLIMDFVLYDKIRQILERTNIIKEEKGLDLESVDPEFRRNTSLQRLFQHELRRIVLKKYNNQCLICGIDNEVLLRVSHIKPVRADHENSGKVENSLLLCSLHDSLFDNGLISIDNDGRIIVSDELKKTKSVRLKKEIDYLESNQIKNESGLNFDNEFFDYHRKHVFKRIKH